MLPFASMDGTTWTENVTVTVNVSDSISLVHVMLQHWNDYETGVNL